MGRRHRVPAGAVTGDISISDDIDHLRVRYVPTPQLVVIFTTSAGSLLDFVAANPDLEWLILTANGTATFTAADAESVLVGRIRWNATTAQQAIVAGLAEDDLVNIVVAGAAGAVTHTGSATVAASFAVAAAGQRTAAPADNVAWIIDDFDDSVWEIPDPSTPGTGTNRGELPFLVSDPEGLAYYDGSAWIANDRSGSEGLWELADLTDPSTAVYRGRFPTGVTSPQAFAIDSQGHGWLIDAAGGEVFEIPDLATPGTGTNRGTVAIDVVGLAFDSAGSLWVLDSANGGQLWEITRPDITWRQDVSRPTDDGVVTPAGLSFDSQGHAWVVASGSRDLWEIPDPTNPGVGTDRGTLPTGLTTPTGVFTFGAAAGPTSHTGSATVAASFAVQAVGRRSGAVVNHTGAATVAASFGVTAAGQRSGAAHTGSATVAASFAVAAAGQKSSEPVDHTGSATVEAVLRVAAAGLKVSTALPDGTDDGRVKLILQLELNGRLQGWTTRTAHTMREPSVHVRQGLIGTAAQDLVATTGSASFTLRNASVGVSGRPYSPGDTAAAGFGIDSGVRLLVDMGDGGGVIAFFTGHIIRIEPTVGENERHFVAVQAADYMDRVARMGPPAVLIDDSLDNVQTAVAVLAENAEVSPRSVRIES